MLHLAITDPEHSRILANGFRFCEYATNLNDNGSQLTVSALRNELHVGCTSLCADPFLRTAKPTRSVASIRHCHEVCGLAGTVRGSGWRAGVRVGTL